MILGGHGITAWGDTRGGRELPVDHRDRRPYIRARRPEPFGAVRVRPLPEKSAAPGPPPWPRPRDRPGGPAPVGTSPTPRVLDSSPRENAGLADWAPAAPTTSCAPKSGRSCRPAGDRLHRGFIARSPEPGLTGDYGPTTGYATEDPRHPGRPASSSSGVGMFSYGPVDARVAGEFYVNAINVMRGARRSPRTPPSRIGEVPISTGRSRRRSCSASRSPSLGDPRGAGDRRGSGIGKATAGVWSPRACVVSPI